MTSTNAAVSIGVAGSLGPDLIARIAASVEEAGFHALWVNDTPDGDAIAALGAAARATSGIQLGTGVVALDRRDPDQVLRALEAADVPDERLILGLGSGNARTGHLDLLRDGIARIRARRGMRIVVGALGPRMRRLAAQDADGPLLSWLTPAIAAAQAAEAHAAGPTAQAHLYVRTAFDPAARDRMLREAARYARYGNYAANLVRLGFDIEDTVLPAADADGAIAADAAVDGLAAYLAAVDEVVLRAMVVEDTLAAYQAFITEAVSVRAAAEARSAAGDGPAA